MKRLAIALWAATPILAAADAFDELKISCHTQNSRYGYILVDAFCSCLDAELRKRVTEEELSEYLHRPPVPEDKIVDEKGDEAGQICREKVDREFKSI